LKKDGSNDPSFFLFNCENKEIEMSLLEQIKEQQKSAMKAKDKVRLTTIRAVIAAIRQIEIDEARILDEAQSITVVTQLIKQRKGSIDLYLQANRQDLVDVEQAELEILSEFLPKQLTSDEVDQMIKSAILLLEAKNMQDMGKVVAHLKPQMLGKADMAAVSQLVKTALI
jgi:uncharacterized protein YqeY